MTKNNTNWPKKIPKIINMYWYGEEFTYLHWISLETMIYYNPDFKIKIYTSKKNETKKTWSTNVQSVKYEGKNYFSQISKKVEVIELDLEKLKKDFPVLKKITNNVHVSDFIRYYLLYIFGGIWCDSDIFFTKSLYEINFTNYKLNCDNIDDIENVIIIYQKCKIFPIGFMMSCQKSKLFYDLLNSCDMYFDINKYQCIGASMWEKILINDDELLKKYENTSFINEKYVYPLLWNEMNKIFTENKNLDGLNQKILNDSVIGLHWYNGCPIIKNFINEYMLEYDCDKMNKDIYIMKLIQDYLSKINN